MKSIKESAEEYGMACADAELHDVANAPTLIDAYLAGATYALEMAEDLADEMQGVAAKILAEGHNDDAAAQHDTAMEISKAIRKLIKPLE